MMNLRDKEASYPTKEGEASSSSRQWLSGLKNPRIVRVSRLFGGKDRHSKVSTIKGLRDRRIRLSVPTAVQLYDLQDRLGLSQPSKVIDWLLDVTKDDIDELPPLPAIPGSTYFSPYQSQPIYSSQGYGMSLSSSIPFFDPNFPSFRKDDCIDINSSLSLDFNNEAGPSIVAKLKHWDAKEKKIGENETENTQVLAQNLFPIASGHHSSLESNHPMSNYNHYLEHSNPSLAQMRTLGDRSSNSSLLPSPLALSSVSPSMPTSSQHAFFRHQQVENDLMMNELRQFNRTRFNLSNNNPFPSSIYPSSTGLGLKHFPFSTTHHPHLHQTDDHHHYKNVDDRPWKL